MSHLSVSQGLQSCLEPRNIEPRVLRLKLAPAGSKNSPQSEWRNNSASSSSNCTIASFSNSSEAYENPISANNTNNEHDSSKPGGCTWSFLQSLSNISHCNNKDEAESVYVHPKVKCSSSMLSAKSLEMCTESLGCETGSCNASETSDEMSLFSLENGTSFMENNTMQVDTNYGPRRLNRGSNFPPPLTSITDLGGLHVRPHREDGRLILEVVTTTFQPYFHADRSNGRLRLRFFESVSSYCSDDEGEEVADDDDEEEEEEEEEEVEEEEEGEALNNEACGEEENEAEEELEKYAGSVEALEDEMGMSTKFNTPRRCKESGRNRDIFGDGYFELPSLSVCL